MLSHGTIYDYSPGVYSPDTVLDEFDHGGYLYLLKRMIILFFHRDGINAICYIMPARAAAV
jgi:hypothetical protein